MHPDVVFENFTRILIHIIFSCFVQDNHDNDEVIQAFCTGEWRNLMCYLLPQLALNIISISTVNCARIFFPLRLKLWHVIENCEHLTANEAAKNNKSWFKNSL